MVTHHIQHHIRERLSCGIAILFIISGIPFDALTFFIHMSKEQWEPLHFLCRELKLLGFSYLLYRALKYDQIKLKTLSFMFVIWSSVIIGYNASMPINTHASIVSIPLTTLYLWWLIRILTFDTKTESKEESYKLIESYRVSGVAYNILMPVSTFRGLLQILFIPWNNPMYETRVLVARGKITGISDNKFTQAPYSESHIRSFIRKNGKVKACQNYSHKKVSNLISQKAWFFFKDCRKLEM